MDSDKIKARRDRMLVEIGQDARDTAFWTGRDRFSDAVMAAMAETPRHEFVSEDQHGAAYVNRPLPIGHGQTISQPFIVALMTDLLKLDKTKRVLEVGTGCGYQTAVLSRVAGKVYSLEVVETLARAAAERLKRLGRDNVRTRQGDGWEGWPERAPFDAIMVTAAPTRVPDALADQLAVGGRMAVPIGRPGDTQILTVCVKRENGALERRAGLPVAFVPMVRNALDKN